MMSRFLWQHKTESTKCKRQHRMTESKGVFGWDKDKKSDYRQEREERHIEGGGGGKEKVPSQ